MRQLIVVTSLLWFSSGVASADAIGPAPACPPGARSMYSHAGEWCQPWACTDDSTCEGARCRPWRVCTQGSMVPPARRRGALPPGVPLDMEPRRMELLVASCEPAARCNGTEEPPPPIIGALVAEPPACVDGSFCVPDALPALPGRAEEPTAPAQATPPSPSGAPPPETAHPGAGRGCSASAGASGDGSIPWALLLLAVRRRR